MPVGFAMALSMNPDAMQKFSVMSEEKKKDYIEDAKRRLHKSRWLLVVILAFLFTFALDVFELIVLPFIFDLIGI